MRRSKLTRMERSTRLAQGQLPPLDRSTIHAFEDATPGPLYYQRFAHPVGLEAERLLGELEGGEALLFPSGAEATTALILALLQPGATVAVADGGVTTGRATATLSTIREGNFPASTTVIASFDTSTTGRPALSPRNITASISMRRMTLWCIPTVGSGLASGLRHFRQLRRPQGQDGFEGGGVPRGSEDRADRTAHRRIL